jgi:hypothetical protein
VTGYRFLPWARQGLAGAVTAAAGGRATVSVKLKVAREDLKAQSSDEEVSVDLQLYGPGDIVGIDGRQIIRRDPAPLTTLFESSYFPAVEFDLPYYPWVFTPDSTPADDRLRPWICLVVVRRDAAKVMRDPGRPLPWLALSPTDAQRELPDLANSWAWAHAQLTGDATLDGPAEQTLSRLLCARRLDPGKAYIAAVVPTFLAGVQAGLGQDVTAGGEPAWPPYTPTEPAKTNFELPVYDHWEFSTGPEGSFEVLAGRLRAAELDAAVAISQMDLTTTGWGVPVPPRGQPGSTLGFEGALTSLRPQATPWPSQPRERYQTKLRSLLITTADGETVLTPPVYGALQAPNVPPPDAEAGGGWLWQLNLDPRYRAAAGLGAQIVAEEQEQLVAAIWDQAGELEAANTILRHAQLARAVAASVQDKRLGAMAEDAVLRVSEPLHPRVQLGPDGKAPPVARRTLRGSVEHSRFPEAAVSAPFRRATRPFGPIGRRLTEGSVFELIVGLAEREVTVPLRKVDGAAEFLPGEEEGRSQLDKAIARIADEPNLGWDGVHGGDFPFYRRLQQPPPDDDQLRLQSIITRFREATHALDELIPKALDVLPQRGSDALAVSDVAGALRDKQGPLAPDRTMQALVRARIPSQLPLTATLGPQAEDPLRPRSVLPGFDQPMFGALRERFADVLLAGADTVAPDSVGVLVGNSRFIEAYMVGLNDALARELRWRDVPTDYGATFFRRFWDAAGADSEAVTDIRPISEWDHTRPLGAHATRVGGLGMLVVLVRSALLYRYPHTIVYVVRADTLDAAPMERYPEFRGQIGADLTFFGFDLGLDEARGGNGAGPGWYLVLQEQPTAPRFGFDDLPTQGGDERFGVEPPATRPGTWMDVHWGMVAPSRSAYEALSHAPVSGPLATLVPPLALFSGAGAPTPRWGVHAGETASACYQQPVRVALHMSDMLKHAGRDLAHRVQAVAREGKRIVKLAGVTATGEPWRMSHADVVDAIARGARGFVLERPDGERPRLHVTDLAPGGPLEALPEIKD